MPQLSIYLDAETIKKIEKAAAIENTSISKWVSARLTGHLENKWPDNYSNLFGSIKDDSFCVELLKD
ncbi:MAG: toxin-antitoxin system, antitoxin component [Firmicutes bacterium]|nr:toxin-antitoxin system, antitoxin component [Bacillota bacterium]